MPSVTFDGRGFMLDGRRVWLMSGTIPFARLPRESWNDRLHAARLAGLNAVVAPVFWARSEPRKGQFDFTGDNDVRAFVEMAGSKGLHVILRPGPYVGGHWDLGGLPWWLLQESEIVMRGQSAPFLEAVSKYLSQLSAQVKDLQINATGEGGPIVLFQLEHQWTCGDDLKAQGYLGEIQRYFRESGFNVPTINANNMWQGLESQIDGWEGDAGLYSVVRQLGHVKPEQPKLIVGFESGADRVHGEPEPELTDPLLVQRRMAEAIAAGGQINLARFCPGVAFEHSSGKLVAGENQMLTADQDSGALVDSGGRPTSFFGPIRRLAMFSSKFASVLGSLDPDSRPVVVDPGAADEPGTTAVGTAVVHSDGAQGSVVFCFHDTNPKQRKGKSVRLLKRDGSEVVSPVGEQQVTWCLFDATLAGRATLDHCTLCALGFHGEILVVFGPGGGTGEISINGSPLEIEVPKGRKPLVERHEAVTVVVVSEAMADETYFGTENGAEVAYVGVASVDAEGAPVGHGKGYVTVHNDGATKNHGAAKAPATAKVSLSNWDHAEASDYFEGTSPRFAAIPGPSDLSSLGTPHGYGWYKIDFTAGAAKRGKIAAPGSGDRLNLFIDGQPAGVLGTGPAAKPELSVSLKKGARTLVVLAENVGRVTSGNNLHEPKGLCEPLYETAAIKVGKPDVVEAEPVKPLEHHMPLYEMRVGDVTHPYRLEWTLTHRKKSPLFVTLGPVAVRGEVIINDEPTMFLEQGETARVTLGNDDINRGKNVIHFAPFNEEGSDGDPEFVTELAGTMASSLTVLEGTNELTSKAEFSFAKWEPPLAAMFRGITKTKPPTPTGPSWWRCRFEVSDASAVRAPELELGSMTKGQVFLNGRHAGGYFTHDAEGKPVEPGGAMPLPASWLKNGENELLVFDEHGGSPAKVNITDRGETTIRA